MNKEDILFWKRKYDSEEDLYNRGEEEELRKKFQSNKFITKEDLIKIVKWKFQGELIGRQKRILNLIDQNDPLFIRDVSKRAFQSKDDENKIELLSSIKGVGNALSSVILTFYDPQNYGILDIHSWRELFGKEPKDLFSNKQRAIYFFNKLREILKEIGFSCRDIEKALFKKNLDQGRI